VHSIISKTDMHLTLLSACTCFLSSLLALQIEGFNNLNQGTPLLPGHKA
jgi:hypothetical protein